jgi:predicted component of type VI protein secretion system
MMVTIMIELDEAIARQAQAVGLLTSESLNALLEAQIEARRKEAAANLLEMMDKMAAHMRAQYPDLTDDEAQRMIDAWIAEADEEIARKDSAESP